MSENFKVALAQFEPKIGDKRYNIRKIEKIADKAMKKKANLLVLPELALTGYTIKDLSYELSEEIPGSSSERVGKIAKEKNLFIIFGQPERSDKGNTILYNTAVFLGPEGYIGKYRKMYLPTHSVFGEKRYFRPGYQTPIFDTLLGKIGILICYDVFFPEVARALRLRGAKTIICISASPGIRRKYFEILTSARAIENTCFLIYVNLVGIENGLQFWGGSRLVGPNGHVIVQSKYNEEDISYGEINYEDIIPIEAFVPTIRDLRPEIFDKIKNLAENL